MSLQGKSPILDHLIEDEGTGLGLRKSLAGAGKRVTGPSVAYAILTCWQTRNLPFEEQPELNHPPCPYIPETKAQLAQLADQRTEIKNTWSCGTAVKWLHDMGYKFRGVHKGIYKDGHECSDVVLDRKEYFLLALKALEDCIVRWELVHCEEGEALEIIYQANLPPGIRPIVLVVDNESTFNANDGRSKIWIKDENISLKKKTRGKGIMVSDFLRP